MSASTFLVEPKTAPPLNVPSSSSTVTVRVIDSTSEIGIPVHLIVQPKIKGHDWIVCPSYSFLITHKNRHILFDLGVSRDPRKLTPVVQKLVKNGDWTLAVAKDVAEILDDDTEVGVKRGDIDTVIWSHHHWDHTGDMTMFPTSTELIVGPGLIENYTGKEDSPIVKEYYENRSFREINFEKDSGGLKIGGCEAFDFFGDGSFYLLHTPGHTIGHICGLARVSSSPDSFIFMGGDASHHCGELRPTEWYPLPKNITPSPIPKIMSATCPGDLVQKIQRNSRADESFYVPSEGFNHDEEEAIGTIRKLEQFDAADNVLMVLAHDLSLLDRMPLFPKTINDWYAQDLGKKTHWAFIEDFAEAIEEVSQ